VAQTRARSDQINNDLAEIEALLDELQERRVTAEARFEELDMQLADTQERHAQLDERVIEAERKLADCREQQRSLERRAFELGGGNYHAPAQLLGDFLAGRASTGPGKVLPSYEPGVVWTDLRECLPEYTVETIQEAIPRINKTLPGFALEDAVLTGVETRSSSPTRIPRDSQTLECISVRHFYPAGEGAGYAGGIISAAADGMRVAEAILREA
jgi:uncharacterized FAD-dependent dehydrogenase